MKTVDYVVIIITMMNILWMCYFAYFGINKWKKGDRNFEWKLMFKNVSVKQSSGTLLLVEAASGLVAIIVFIFAYLGRRLGYF